MNNSSLSIEPWGMPHDTYCSVDKTLFTYFFLSYKNRVIVTLLPLLRRQAKVKTTRYTIQPVICASFSGRFSK